MMNSSQDSIPSEITGICGSRDTLKIGNSQTQSSPIRWHQLYATFAAVMGSVGIGCVLAYTATALPDLRLRKPFGEVTSSQEKWIGPLALLPGIVASPVAGGLIEWIGRRGALIWSMPVFVGGWIFIIFAQNTEMIYAGRVITGFIHGILSLVIPIFISEVSSPEIRGALTSCYDMSVTIGILYIYLIGTWADWKYQAVCCALVPALSGILLIFVPESPLYLMEKGETEKAKKASQWYYNISGNDLTKTKEDPESQKTTLPCEYKVESQGWKDIVNPSVFKPLSICLIFVLFYQFSGIIPITAYTVDIFHAAGTDIDDNLSTNLVGIIQVVATISSVLTVDRCGRRLLLLLSEGFMVLSMIGMSTYFYLKSHPSIYSPDQLSFLPLTSLLVYVVAFSIGVGPIVWVYLGEILPLHFKGKGSGIIMTVSFSASFLVTLEFGNLMEALGYEGGYALFGCISLLGFFFIYFFVPETKGKTLQEIQAYFM